MSSLLQFLGIVGIAWIVGYVSNSFAKSQLAVEEKVIDRIWKLENRVLENLKEMQSYNSKRFWEIEKKVDGKEGNS